MRIAVFVPAPFATVSGGYAYDRRIVAGLRAAGHAVEVVEIDGRHPMADDAAFASACSAWERLERDTIPLIDGLALPAFAEHRAELRGRGAVGLIHHPTSLETGFSEIERGALRRVETQLMPELARVVVTSDPTKERLVAEFGVAEARIAVVVPGTDDAPRSVGSSDKMCRILSVGMLIPRKGHAVLLRSLARLFDLDWQLTIVGSATRDPVCANGLAALAEELGVAARVRLAGEISDDALAELWHAADLFALATYWEGYGMVVAEALKRGLPVAVTSGGAAASLVPLEAGIVCAPGDIEQFSKALRRPVFDATLRHAMAEAAWQAGQRLPTWAQQVEAFARALG